MPLVINITIQLTERECFGFRAVLPVIPHQHCRQRVCVDVLLPAPVYAGPGV